MRNCGELESAALEAVAYIGEEVGAIYELSKEKCCQFRRDSFMKERR